MALKSVLSYFIEPDFGLRDHLLGLHVLNLRQLTDIRSERTVFRRNDALLDLLTTEDQCVKFLKALQRTDQQHVVNFIKENGGQKHNHVIICMANVAHVGYTVHMIWISVSLSITHTARI